MTNSLASVINMAIDKEKESYDFYMDLYGRVEDPAAKETLRYIAREEARHGEFLTSCRKGLTCADQLKMDSTVDYRIIEHMEKPDIKKNMNSSEIYLVAANRELNAFNFYESLADSYPTGEVRELLSRMANEELKHKEKMEYLYANTAFPQTDGG
ncbi:MAG: ferritin family protein [Syntrophales bacterium]|nr:ferritin family protein [Syntrophales bacterium]